MLAQLVEVDPQLVGVVLLLALHKVTEVALVVLQLVLHPRAHLTIMQIATQYN